VRGRGKVSRCPQRRRRRNRKFCRWDSGEEFGAPETPPASHSRGDESRVAKKIRTHYFRRRANTGRSARGGKFSRGLAAHEEPSHRYGDGVWQRGNSLRRMNVPAIRAARPKIRFCGAGCAWTTLPVQRNPHLLLRNVDNLVGDRCRDARFGSHPG